MLGGRGFAALTVVLLSVALGGCGGTSSAGQGAVADPVEREALSLHTGVLRPPNVEPALTLTDTSGAAYDVTKRGAGKVTLLYFGYTHCPDVCPTTMADIAQAFRTVSPEVRDKVVVVFVSVDPHRDSAAVIRDWLDRFSPSFVGLRGPLPNVITAERAAHLPVSKVSKSGKAVEHAAQVVVYTPDRLEHAVFVDGPSTIQDLEHDLPILTTGPGFGA